MYARSSPVRGSMIGRLNQAPVASELRQYLKVTRHLNFEVLLSGYTVNSFHC